MIGKAEITTESIVDTYLKKKPHLVWIMNKDVFIEVWKLRNSEGKYLYSPDLIYNNKPGTLLGVDIILSKDAGYRLAIQKDDGSIAEL